MVRKMGYFLITCIALTLLNGCGGKEKSNALATNKAVGRYIEIDVPLPEEIQNRNIETIAVLRNEENDDVEIYTSLTNQTFRKYTLTRNGNWYSKELEWDEDVGTNDRVNSLQYGLDGNLYMHVWSMEEGNPSLERNRLMRVNETDGVTTLYDSLADGYDIRKDGEKIRGFTALKNGNPVIHYQDGKKSVVYDPTMTNKLMEFEHYSNHVPGLGERTISVIDKSRKGVSVYDVHDGSQKYEARYSDVYMGENELLYYKEGKGTYLFNPEGIHYLAEEAFLWETLLEGKLASMGMPIMEIKDAFMGKNNDFYVYYESSEINVSNGTRLKHYVYDENSPMVPEQVLTIYSLYESDLINQAIGYFRNENPGVYVNYKVVIPNKAKVDVEDRKYVLTEEEYVRILDQEIREGDSADIVVCDKLPIGDYIDQGILSDVGDLLWPLMVRDEIFPLVTRCYKQGNDVFAIPLRFEAYALLGDKELVQHAEYFKIFIQNAKENGYYDLVASDMDWRGMIDGFYYLYAHEFLYKDGKTLKGDRLVRFLNKIMELEGLRSRDNQYGISKYFASTIALKGYALGKSRVANTSISSILDFRELEGVLEYKNGEVCWIPSYKPLSTVGIHKECENKELAGEFIQTLLSSDVQKQRYPNDVGITVNQRAFVEWLQLEEVWNEGIYNYGTGDEMGNKMYEYVHMPSSQRKDFYLDWFQGLKVPLFSDQENIKIIKEESQGFFENQLTAEEAVERIVERLSAK